MMRHPTVLESTYEDYGEDNMIRVLPFVIIAIELFVIYKLVKRRPSKRIAFRWAAATAILASLLLFWINGAVGIIGDANNDMNMLYLSVIVIAFLGSLASGFKPKWCAWSMVAAAILQTTIAAFAVILRSGIDGPIWPFDLLLLTVFFVLLWLGAALLFFRAQIDDQNVE